MMWMLGRGVTVDEHNRCEMRDGRKIEHTNNIICHDLSTPTLSNGQGQHRPRQWDHPLHPGQHKGFNC